MAFDDELYEPGTPLESPSRGAMQNNAASMRDLALATVVENAAPAAYARAGDGDYGMTGSTVNGVSVPTSVNGMGTDDDSSDSADVLYAPAKKQPNVPTPTTSHTNIHIAGHSVASPNVELQIALSAGSQMDQEEHKGNESSDDDDDNEEMYKKSGKKITKQGTIEGGDDDEDNSVNFAFQT